jgi:hypothetical protein
MLGDCWNQAVLGFNFSVKKVFFVFVVFAFFLLVF